MTRRPLSKSAQAFLAARNFCLRHRTDYETARRDFTWPRLVDFNWALDYFDVMAAGNDAAALQVVNDDGSEQIRSFASMAVRSSQVAHFLRDHGIRRGDCVLLMLGNEVALWESLLALMKIGAVVSPATGLLTADDISERVARGGVRGVIAGSAFASKFQHLRAPLIRVAVGSPVQGWIAFDESHTSPAGFEPDGPTHADDPLLLYFTSGTTAKPKMVLHTHQSYPVGHLSTLFYAGLQPGDRHWNISSPGWAKHAWSCFFTPWNAEATVFIYNYARFRAEAVLEILVRHQVTTICAPPTVWRMLVQEPLTSYRVSLREALSAGEPLNPVVIEQVQAAWNVTIRDGYGQTETTALVGNAPGTTLKPGSMGRPLIGMPIVLLDQEGSPSHEGEVCIDLSGAPIGLTPGYYGDDAITSAAMRDGYYHTGDVAVRDDDGYLTFVGRLDDVFKSADYRISPFEIESVLVEHDAVAEAAVVPSLDDIRHAVPKAFVVLAAGCEPTRALAGEILAYAASRLAPYKRVRRIEFADLPKTISGKIRRVELRELERERRTSGARLPLEFFEEEFAAGGSQRGHR
jgi:acetyl-CoA synthetase